MSKKNFSKRKSYGFYVTLGLILLAIVSAIIYASFFHVTRYMSWGAVAVMIGGAVVALLLPIFKQAKLSCFVLALTNFVGFLMYAYYIYFYVSIVLVGIQASSFSWQFILCTTLFGVLLVGSILNIFFEQEKEIA